MYVCINFIQARKSHHYIDNALPESRAIIYKYIVRKTKKKLNFTVINYITYIHDKSIRD